jgi:hypothetical protein
VVFETEMTTKIPLKGAPSEAGPFPYHGATIDRITLNCKCHPLEGKITVLTKILGNFSILNQMGMLNDFL